MDISYDYYRVFDTVAACGSLTRAAELLGNNQPNVSRCMNRLEGELGCRLLVRSNRGIALTPEGRQLYGHVRLACGQLRAGEEELAGRLALESGSVSVAASETALHVLLLRRLREFRRDYPGIRLRLSNHSTPQALAALRSGEAEAAVVTTPTDAAKPLREFPLAAFREVLVGGPRFADLRRRTLTLAERPESPNLLGGRSMPIGSKSNFLLRGLTCARHGGRHLRPLLPLILNDLGWASCRAHARTRWSGAEVTPCRWRSRCRSAGSPGDGRFPPAEPRAAAFVALSRRSGGIASVQQLVGATMPQGLPREAKSRTALPVHLPKRRTPLRTLSSRSARRP